MGVSYSALTDRLDVARRQASLDANAEFPDSGAKSLDELADLLSACGQFEEALRAGRITTESYRRIGDRAGLIRSEIRNAHALIQLGRHDEAVSVVGRLLDEVPEHHPKRRQSYGQELCMTG